MNNDLMNKQAVADWLVNHGDWQVTDINGVPALWRRVSVADFNSAMYLANQIAVLAEQQNHHPQLTLSWGALEIHWWSHDVQGISERDISMAIHTDRTIQELKRKK